MANETVLFKRGDSATITSTPITDGQILFDTSGNGKMYLDNGTTRLAMGGSVTIDSTLSKTSTNAVQNKAVTGNILNSLAEVSAATQQNTIAGALALKEVNSSLKANSKQVYMDYHDGKYGINTDPNRGADTFIPFHSGDFVFCGGSQQILRTNWTYLDYSFKFNYCKADTVSFANNIITFLQARQYKLTLNYTHNLKRIYIKAKLNNTELETRYFDTEAKRTWELELNVQKGDTLSFSVQCNDNTSMGDPWCDSTMVIE